MGKKENQGIDFTIESGRWHCIEMDKFWHHLAVGDNHVTRKSTESSVTIPTSQASKSLFMTLMPPWPLVLNSTSKITSTSVECPTGCSSPRAPWRVWTSCSLLWFLTHPKMIMLPWKAPTSAILNVASAVRSSLTTDLWVSPTTGRCPMSACSRSPILRPRMLRSTTLNNTNSNAVHSISNYHHTEKTKVNFILSDDSFNFDVFIRFLI